MDGAVKDGDVIQMSCNVNYSGTWQPTMTWKRNDVKMYTHVTTKSVQNRSLISSVTLTVSKTDSGNKFSCKTHFSDVNSPRKAPSTNSPEYTWTSPVFDVMCKYCDNVVMMTFIGNYHDVISCHFHGVICNCCLESNL